MCCSRPGLFSPVYYLLKLKFYVRDGSSAAIDTAARLIVWCSSRFVVSGSSLSFLTLRKERPPLVPKPRAYPVTPRNTMVVFDKHEHLTEEEKRLKEDRDRTKYWKKWGSYLAERQWATGTSSATATAGLSPC